jgi:putative sigma-54 modulation protein
MLIDIQARDFTLTDALRQHAENRIRYALSRNDERILRVVMRFADGNGLRGGADKRCHLRVVLCGMPELVTDDTEANLYLAINRATTRASRTLARRLQRPIPRTRPAPASTDPCWERADLTES